MAAEAEVQIPEAAAAPTAEPVATTEVPADGKPVAEENPKPAKEKKTRASKAPREKKPRVTKPASPSHPTYFQMIKEAILAHKEKGGLSPHAIAKHMEETYKAVLPANFRKTLMLQLKNCVAKGKLVKVKGSFKLFEAGKDTAVNKPAAAGKEKRARAAASAAPKSTKGKVDTKKRKRKAPAASKPAAATKAKAAKVGVKKSKKAAPAKPKQPKSIKSPVAKKARKAAAA